MGHCHSAPSLVLALTIRAIVPICWPLLPTLMAPVLLPTSLGRCFPLNHAKRLAKRAYDVVGLAGRYRQANGLWLDREIFDDLDHRLAEHPLLDEAQQTAAEGSTRTAMTRGGRATVQQQPPERVAAFLRQQPELLSQLDARFGPSCRLTLLRLPRPAVQDAHGAHRSARDREASGPRPSGSRPASCRSPRCRGSARHARSAGRRGRPS